MRFESHGFSPNEDYRWKAGKETIDNLFETGHILFNEDGIPMEKKYAHEEEDPLYPIYCFVDPDISGTAEQGKTELNKLVGNKHGFDTVKPVQMIKYLIATFSSDDDTVLDFYSGTSTTWQAVLEQNAEDGGARKSIMIQFPQEIDESSEAYSAGFRTVCDIAKRRIKAVGEKIKNIDNNQLFQDSEYRIPDIGFRVLQVDSSNFNDTYSSPQETTQQSILGLIDNVKGDRMESDLLFQVLPKFRIPYSAHIEEFEINGKKIFDVDGGLLLACFDIDVTTDVIEQIAKRKPSYAVMRDLSFKDDATEANFEELFKTFSPDTIRRVI